MVNISESASQQIKNLLSQGSNPRDSFLRVKVVPGGCSGFSYKLDFDQAMQPADKVFEENGTKVVIDSKSLLYILGMTLDYEGGLNGKGFMFSNPNASKTCGCGSSFNV